MNNFNGFDSKANTAFTFMPIMMFIVFGLVITFFIIAIVKGLRQWTKNTNSPILSVEAKLVAKRINVRHSSSMNTNSQMHSSSSTHYYVTFEVESGDRLEFQVPGDEYGLLIEGDQGKLTFQGTRYKGFIRR